MELAGFRTHFGSRAFWKESREHLVEADRGWCYTMGEQVPESFIMSQLLGLLLPSAKKQDDVPGKYAADYLKRRPFLCGIFKEENREAATAAFTSQVLILT